MRSGKLDAIRKARSAMIKPTGISIVVALRNREKRAKGRKHVQHGVNTHWQSQPEPTLYVAS
jgi:hypothetical protein